MLQSLKIEIETIETSRSINKNRPVFLQAFVTVKIIPITSGTLQLAQ